MNKKDATIIGGIAFLIWLLSRGFSFGSGGDGSGILGKGEGGLQNDDTLGNENEGIPAIYADMFFSPHYHDLYIDNYFVSLESKGDLILIHDGKVSSFTSESLLDEVSKKNYRIVFYVHGEDPYLAYQELKKKLVDTTWLTTYRISSEDHSLMYDEFRRILAELSDFLYSIGETVYLKPIGNGNWEVITSIEKYSFSTTILKILILTSLDKSLYTIIPGVNTNMLGDFAEIKSLF